MKKIGFDNAMYLQLQSRKITERIERFGGKLYLEFGGKLFDDYHASRVLPGFEPDSKVRMLQQLRDEAEIVIVIHAGDIEESKRRGDLGITYDQEVLRLIDAFRASGLTVGSVVVTLYRNQEAADRFIKRLDALGVKTYKHYPIEDYPANIQLVLSEDGFGRNDYVETNRRLVVVTGPGGGSGKMAVCLSQLYHEQRRGHAAGYAKYETFPVWSLPLRHPVNLAYEASTADLKDVIMIDPYHLEAHGETAVNYNRDMEVFPVLRVIFERIMGTSPYQSPTDMGVNMISFCVTDDEAVCEASKQEIIRRYYEALCERRQGFGEQDAVNKLELLMRQVSVTAERRPVVGAALTRAEETDGPAVAIELPDGQIVTGKTTPLLGASSAALLNALKALGHIPKRMRLISPNIIKPIQHLKINHMGNRNPRLHTDEVLIALTISAASNNPSAELAMEQLEHLRDCEAHSTVLLSRVDQNTFRNLGVNLTCEARYETKQLYHG
ncbi:MAG: DUF1846 domain-containing protein [Oscillospiraceae bacterium]|jgi:uncharacterized protein (UPF0371 family)|nr:DUF1846 domain-containing protein [Oscillospiraceae bacterium]